MDFTFNEEQRLLQESAQQFFAENSTSEKIRAAMQSDLGYDAGVWKRLTEEMGWSGIAIPEAYGGLGLGHIETAIVQCEMGRALFSSPFFSSSCLAAPAILSAGTTAQCEQWLPEIAAGSKTAALALTGKQARPGVDGIEVTLSNNADGSFSLNGVASFVVLGHAVDWLVIAARAANSKGNDGVSLLLLPRTASGIVCEKLVALDLTRPYAQITFNNVRVDKSQILGEAGNAAAAFNKTLALGNIALAAEQAGGAERIMYIAVDYAKQRQQFGRLIGSFQALKHIMADMLTVAEAAKSAAYYAACTADEEPTQIFEAAAIAKSYCGDAYYRCAADALQIHGGMGYTWECDVHLYFKRARASQNLLGDNRYQREQLAEQIFSGAVPALTRG